MRALFFFLATSLVLAVAPPWAHAEDVASYEIEGEADASGGDPRVAALDDAFSRATGQALLELLDPETRRANKAAINAHILGRARLWVAKFTVTRDATVDGRRQLSVSVRVDRDKLRARLAELHIATAVATPEPTRPAAHPVVVLLRTSDPTGARASYGATAEKDLPGLGALSSALRDGGMSVVRAPASGPAARGGGELPLDDAEAEALAAESRAELAAVAGVTIGAPVAVRGLPTVAVLVTANVRLLGRGGAAVGQGTASVAARSSEPAVIDAAIERAVVAAASDAVPAPQRTLGPSAGFTGDDVPVGEPGVVLVRLAPRTPWGLVAAEQKHLSGARGIQRAVLRRVSPGGWVIGVTTTESVERIAQIARKAPTSELSAKVKVVGEVVEVALTGAP
ncbi:MAG: hypothetical protein ACTHU0_11655 [Kofleriaceae bacterium]